MPTLDERIALEREKLEQLQRRKRAQGQHEKECRRKDNERRKYIIGAMISQYFPEVENFQPRRTNAENDVEFAPLANFLSQLAADREYVTQLKERAAQQTLPDNRQGT